MIGRTNHTQFSAATNESSQTTLQTDTATDTAPEHMSAKPAPVHIIDAQQTTARVFGDSILDRPACHSPQQFQTLCDELRVFVATHGLDAVKAAIRLYKTQRG